jgi:hypothetical protein
MGVKQVACNRNAQRLMLNVQLNIKSYALNILWKHEIRPSTGSGRPEPVEGRFTRNMLSGDFPTNRHEQCELDKEGVLILICAAIR